MILFKLNLIFIAATSILLTYPHWKLTETGVQISAVYVYILEFCENVQNEQRLGVGLSYSLHSCILWRWFRIIGLLLWGGGGVALGIGD